MFRCLRVSLACLVFSSLCISIAAQAPPSADSYVTKSSPATNYGSAPVLAVQQDTTSYVQFDLSALPEGASIAKATLRLYVNGVLAPGSFDVYQVNDKWDESTLNYNNAPALGASATGGRPANISASTLNHFIVVDITPLVQGWLSGAVANNGVALALAGSPTAALGVFSFDSKENQLTGHQPELEVALNAAAGGAISPGTPDSPRPQGRAEQAVEPPVALFIWNTSSPPFMNRLQPSASFNVDGYGSVGTVYQIQRNTVLADDGSNLSVGFGAGSFHLKRNAQAPDANDTFVGNLAGTSNRGNNNTFVGSQAGTFSTTGSNNTFLGYEAGLSNSGGGLNTFVGSGAGAANTNGNFNTFSGAGAGENNTGGGNNTFYGYAAGFNNRGFNNLGGHDNTYYGSQAGFSNTSAVDNAFFGSEAGKSTISASNAYFGWRAGAADTGFGGDNTFIGTQAGETNAGASNANTFVGYQAGNSNTGTFNTMVGSYTGVANSGSRNVFLGSYAGNKNRTGNDNIYIANQGAVGGTVSGQIAIGTSGRQNSTFIAGISGFFVPSGVPVLISPGGNLGTTTSSRRFKEQIRDMDDSSTDLFKLRPVTFLYKPEYGRGERTLQYGLIAEEVADVYPELVAYDDDGKPYAVRYQYLDSMLLNEVQKQYHRAAAEAKVIEARQDQIDSQQQQIEDLQQRLWRLEGLLGSTVESVAMSQSPAAASK